MIRSRYAAVVAACENDIIGNGGELPWRLSSDLKRFKSLTMGHHLIMGRKTIDSIGRLLPGRTTVVMTRQSDFVFPGALIAHSIEEIETITASDPQPMVVGGGEIYRLFWPMISDFYLTRVHTRGSGDTTLPPIDWSQWNEVSRETHAADERNQFSCTFLHYRRTDQD
jgi:dihydrofolate reductase